VREWARRSIVRASSSVSGRRDKNFGTGHLLREALFSNPLAGWTTKRDAEHTAQQGNRMIGLLRLDEPQDR